MRDRTLHRQMDFPPASIRECHSRICVKCKVRTAANADHGLGRQFHFLADEFFGEWIGIADPDRNMVPLCTRCHKRKSREEDCLSVHTDKQAILRLANKFLKLAFKSDGSRKVATISNANLGIAKRISRAKMDLVLARRKGKHPDAIDALHKKIARLSRIAEGSQRGR